VQTPDDEQFEAYLKRFRPIAPGPAPTLSVGHSSRRSPPLGIWLAAVAAIFVWPWSLRSGCDRADRECNRRISACRFLFALRRKLAVPIVAHRVQDTIDVLLIFLGKYPGGL
jgi:hypothetical protein